MFRRLKDILSKNAKQRNNFYKYETFGQIWNDYFNGNGIKHKESPDDSFKRGDIVTSAGGWDFGIVSEDCENYKYPLVYGKIDRHNYYAIEPSKFGGNAEWYKTGVNISIYDWMEVWRKFVRDNI